MNEIKAIGLEGFRSLIADSLGRPLRQEDIVVIPNFDTASTFEIESTSRNDFVVRMKNDIKDKKDVVIIKTDELVELAKHNSEEISNTNSNKLKR